MSESNQWVIDASHSNAGFTVKHMMITNVRGEFTKLEGKVSWDPSKPEATQIEAVIDVSSISTRDEKRDGHLKEPGLLRRREISDHHLQVQVGQSQRHGRARGHR